MSPTGTEWGVEPTRGQSYDRHHLNRSIQGGSGLQESQDQAQTSHKTSRRPERRPFIGVTILPSSNTFSAHLLQVGLGGYLGWRSVLAAITLLLVPVHACLPQALYTSITLMSLLPRHEKNRTCPCHPDPRSEQHRPPTWNVCQWDGTDGSDPIFHLVQKTIAISPSQGS